MTKRWLIVAVVVFFPLAAWALDVANERAAAAGDYLPGADETTQFGRMAAGGDYLPGGEGSGGVSSGTNNQGNVWNLLRRYRSKWAR